MAARVGALGIGVSPVHSEVPRELVDACADVGLPLLVVAEGTPFVMVTRTFAEILELKRIETLKSLADTNKRLMRETMQPRPEHELLIVAARPRRRRGARRTADRVALPALTGCGADRQSGRPLRSCAASVQDRYSSGRRSAR
ncbi:hypothetical protein [Cryobacterium algoritolerans]|uniref:hypothetical protein n=1 Tax=Cryobacterium algoritolerans TaxID=1259184 RepID=UPI00141B2A41|nr:hypothetical protein [Cryobacterium algoritolerans]